MDLSDVVAQVVSSIIVVLFEYVLSSIKKIPPTVYSTNIRTVYSKSLRALFFMPKVKEVPTMPTVECVRVDCQYHGIEICIAKRVAFDGCQCQTYKPRIGRQMMDAFNPRCRKEGGRFKSSRVTGVLK
jgi:hypothetical protein